MDSDGKQVSFGKRNLQEQDDSHLASKKQKTLGTPLAPCSTDAVRDADALFGFDQKKKPVLHQVPNSVSPWTERDWARLDWKRVSNDNKIDISPALLQYDVIRIVSNNCNKAVAVVSLRPENENDFASSYSSSQVDVKLMRPHLGPVVIKGYLNKNVAEREIYFHRRLQSVSVNGKCVVPKLVSVWSSNDNRLFKKTEATNDSDPGPKTYYFMATECWIGNMKDLYALQGEVYTASQMQTMFMIARVVGEHDVIHTDLKPDNFLYRHNGKELEICLTDFELAGGYHSPFIPKWGWPSVCRELGAPEEHSNLKEPYPDAAHFNVWELQMEMVYKWSSRPDGILVSYRLADGRETVDTFIGVRDKLDSTYAFSFCKTLNHIATVSPRKTGFQLTLGLLPSPYTW